MWYFAWVLGIGFAVLLAILNTLWGEHEDEREAARVASIRGRAENGHDGDTRTA
ncbi:cytochrome bd-I oxidase subunit CydX [Methyloversatilis thermotolerans]|uniref:cytochrome bd-I oxidase subunit CydX n=1 Tax=Methyloversatilis thermotolerans TaxID=1346290 RepID=UPI0003A5DF92